MRLRAAPEEVGARWDAIPPPLRAALKPFQAEGVEFALRRCGWALIADEMGLGKTIQAIALMAAYQEEWPALVVVPASCRLQWVEELERWLPGLLPPCAIHVIQGSADRVRWVPDTQHPDGGAQAPGQGGGVEGCRGWKDGMPPVTVTSYYMLERLTCAACKRGGAACPSRAGKAADKCPGPGNCMAQLPWGMVVMDESHNMRTSSAASGRDSPVTEALGALLSRRRPTCPRRCVMLSGTPSLVRPYDMFRQVDALRPNLLGSRRQFAERYCERRLVPAWQPEAARQTGAEGGSMRWSHSGGRFLGELHGLLKREVMVRRLKAQVALQLPPKLRHVVHFPRPPPERWPDGGVDWEEAAEAQGDEERPPRMSAEHSVGLAKVADVIDWVTSVLPGCAAAEDGDEGLGLGGGKKLLVFAHHRDVMDRLQEGLEGALGRHIGAPAAGWRAMVRIDGETPGPERMAAVARFRCDATCLVALLSITAAGTGLDFSAASAVVFAELPSDVGLVLQAEARAHRTGCAQASVTCYFLLSKRTVDDRRWQLLGAQLVRQQQLLDAASAPTAPAHIAVDTVVDLETGLPQRGAPRSATPPPSPDSVSHVSDSLQECAEASPGDEPISAWQPPGGCPSPPEQAAAGSSPATALAGEAGLALVTRQDPSRTKGTLAGNSACRLGAQSHQVDFFYEVSSHTQRVHFHASPDGAAPLGLSLPMEQLLASLSSGSGAASGDEQQAAQSSTLASPWASALAAALADGGEVAARVADPIAAAAAAALGVQRCARALEGAAALAAEWMELRPIDRAKLAGKVVACPLEGEIEKLKARDAAAGNYGRGTKRRLLGPGAPAGALPEGAVWHTVAVSQCMSSEHQQYRQAFSKTGERLCVHCLNVVLSCAFPSPSAILPDRAALFCSADCDRAAAVATSSGAARRALYQLERGVCQECRLDCQLLLRRLQMIRKGSPNWRTRRRLAVYQMAPDFADAKHHKWVEHMVTSAVAGNVWHADHIVAVFQGGGGCGVENLRTLCVRCHSAVTSRQAAQRAEARQARKKAVRMRHAQRKKQQPRRHIDSDSSDDCGVFVPKRLSVDGKPKRVGPCAGQASNGSPGGRAPKDESVSAAAEDKATPARRTPTPPKASTPAERVMVIGVDYDTSDLESPPSFCRPKGKSASAAAE